MVNANILSVGVNTVLPTNACEMEAKNSKPVKTGKILLVTLHAFKTAFGLKLANLKKTPLLKRSTQL